MENTQPTKNDPVIIELGRVSKKKVRQFLRGEGPLLSDIDENLNELKANGTVAANAQLVIVVVKQKRRKRSTGMFGI
jgi:hypothetical protein